MDIVEYAEKICGRQLPEWQKEFLRKWAENPDVKLHFTESSVRKAYLDYVRRIKGEYI